MRVVHTRAELAEAREELARPVALVPTMGALHEGHRELVRHAREIADNVVVSIFVNPLQFAPGEDLERYPRTLDADLATLEEEKAALVWVPSVQDMYPYGEPVVRVDPGPAGRILEGASRPGHFAGVLTVVARFINATKPDVAVFGEKDAQQLALIRRMVDDLDLGTTIEGVATVRENDGLALSSRNRYLSDVERAQALAISRALRTGSLAEARILLDHAEGIDLDYCELVDPVSFTPLPADAASGRLVIAARVGTTRLIDNRLIHPDINPDINPDTDVS